VNLFNFLLCIKKLKFKLIVNFFIRYCTIDSSMNNNNKYQIKKKSNKPRKNNGGVILVEKEYDNKKGRCEPAIILFRENSMIGRCTDAGGTQDPSDIDVKHTAMRELQEESANLFRFDHLNLTPFQSYTNQNYTCFFIYIEPICAEHYNDNLKILRQNLAPQCWLETNKLYRFYVSDLLKMNLDEYSPLFDVTDADGNNNLTIKPRTKKCIRMGIEQIKLQKEYIKLNENLDFTSETEPFLNKTKCYHL